MVSYRKVSDVPIKQPKNKQEREREGNVAWVETKENGWVKRVKMIQVEFAEKTREAGVEKESDQAINSIVGKDKNNKATIQQNVEITYLLVWARPPNDRRSKSWPKMQEKRVESRMTIDKWLEARSEEAKVESSANCDPGAGIRVDKQRTVRGRCL